jgi:hypothetical protein
MKRTATCIATLTLGALLAGCQGKGTAEKAGQEQAPVAGTPAPAAGADAVTPVGADIQLAGTLGCGHCSYSVTSECAAAVKTASGEIYVLDGIDDKSEMWEKRLEEGHQITLAGKMVGGEPTKHVAMTSYELK